MHPKQRIPTHPGQILVEEFLTPTGIPQTLLAAHLKVSVQRINELINGKRGMTSETAWLLAAAFKTSPDFWMNLQTQHDLAKNRPTRMLAAIRAPRARMPARRKASTTPVASLRKMSAR